MINACFRIVCDFIGVSKCIYIYMFPHNMSFHKSEWMHLYIYMCVCTCMFSHSMWFHTSEWRHVYTHIYICTHIFVHKLIGIYTVITSICFCWNGKHRQMHIRMRKVCRLSPVEGKVFLEMANEPMRNLFAVKSWRY